MTDRHQVRAAGKIYGLLRSSTDREPEERLALIEEWIRAGYRVEVESDTAGNAGYLLTIALCGLLYNLAYIVVRDRVKNPDGSDKFWVLRVPPGYQNPSAGIPWTFGLASHAWLPVKET